MSGRSAVYAAHGSGRCRGELFERVFPPDRHRRNSSAPHFMYIFILAQAHVLPRSSFRDWRGRGGGCGGLPTAAGCLQIHRHFIGADRGDHWPAGR